MMYSSVYPLNLNPEITKNIIRYLREIFSMQFPTFDKNICDEQNYQKNLINSLYWSHQLCEYIKKNVFILTSGHTQKFFIIWNCIIKSTLRNFFKIILKI